MPSPGKHDGPLRRVCIAGAIKGDPNAGLTTGYYIAKAILELNRRESGTFEEVLIIGRGELKDLPKHRRECADELIGLGARYAAVDYSDVDKLAGSLAGIQCTISALSLVDPKAIEVSEINLVRASAKAGVTRFFPSQYGPDDENLPRERIWRISKRKRAVIDEAIRCGLEYTAVVTGVYYDIIWRNAPLDWYFDGKKAISVHVGPDGAGEVMSISLDDIGAYIAAMISDPDQSKSRNRTVRIFTESWKTGEQRRMFEEIVGVPVEVERHPLGHPVDDRSKYPQYQRLIAFNHYWVDPKLNDTKLWPQVRPKGMREWLTEQRDRGLIVVGPRLRPPKPKI
ncbi:hypothetical protein DFJ74DRAFT_660082 [Hyaloraphidium curvatum]|nr:hypothetical protein DFJ74DRAFT_660082 [Hyaloraphidium curvatum]